MHMNMLSMIGESGNKQDACVFGVLNFFQRFIIILALCIVRIRTNTYIAVFKDISHLGDYIPL